MWLAFLFGVSFATAPMLSFGPFKIFVLSSSLRDGWRKSLVLALVPLLADVPIIVLLWFLIGNLPERAVTLLRVTGGAFYIYLAYNLYRNIGRSTASDGLEQSPRRTFWQAVAALWVTPQVYINWGIIGIPALIRYSQESTATAAAFVVGFYGVWVPGLAAQIFITGMARQVGREAPRLLIYAGSLLLLTFGVLQVWQGLTQLV